MKIGIIGLPNAGKTTVFNALTRNNVFTGSFASAAGEHHLGRVNVPDPRFDALVKMYRPKKESPAVVELVDVAGLSKGSGRQEGAMDEMLKFIRDVDALIHVVRAFEDEAVPHPEETVDPARDIGTVDAEMILHDMMAVEKRLERLEKDLPRLARDKRQGPEAEKALMERFRAHLEEEKPLRALGLAPAEVKAVAGYALLSLKPLLILVNVGEAGLAGAGAIAGALAPKASAPALDFCGKIEAELSQLSPEDAALFMTDLGLVESGLDRVIRAAYDLLGVQSFFTVGEDDVHAWTIRKGDSALTAAGKIHTDLARGFIRAEVVAYDIIVAAGSWNKAKEAGKMHLEGKDYVVRDGDIISVRFNV